MYFVNALLAFVFSFIVFFKLIRLTNKQKSKSFGMNLLLHAKLKMNWTVTMFQERLSKVTNLGKQTVMNS